MPAPLRVVLTEAEELTLEDLRQATTVPKRTRDSPKGDASRIAPI